MGALRVSRLDAKQFCGGAAEHCDALGIGEAGKIEDVVDLGHGPREGVIGADDDLAGADLGDQVAQPFRRPLASSSGVPCGWMKMTIPNSSALAQNGFSLGSESSVPLTLPPTSAPRIPSRLTASCNCSAARSG